MTFLDSRPQLFFTPAVFWLGSLSTVVLNSRDQQGKLWFSQFDTLIATLKQAFAENTHLNASILF